MNYYELLEISKNASEEVIKNAYRALAKKYHPDAANQDSDFFEEKMRQINEAYEVLSNKEKRAAYDFSLQQKEIEEKLENEKVQTSSSLVNDNKNFVSQENSKIKQDKVESKESLLKKEKKQKIIIISLVAFITVFLVTFIIVSFVVEPSMSDKKEDADDEVQEDITKNNIEEKDKEFKDYNTKNNNNVKNNESYDIKNYNDDDMVNNDRNNNGSNDNIINIY